jgi:hypothetical protein
MGYQRSVRVWAAHWTDVSARLSGDTLRYLIDLAGQLRLASADQAAAIAETIGRVLDQVLPGDDQVLPGDDHPVRQALDAPDTRGTTVIEDWQEVAAELLRQAEDPDLAGDVPRAPSAAEVRFWTSRFLLAESALSEDELEVRGQSPGDRDLIRLERHDGGEQWPAFQFGADGAPLSLVRIVNRLLDADGDPWGAADWWLGHNQWLDGVPARLLGQLPDDLLLEAARAVDPGV